tara:strand:+ start:52 stop:207 length:156 start_codon:yes stop_codon:yes gene_type:complete
MKNTNKLSKFDLDNFIKKNKTEKKDFIISESQKVKEIENKYYELTEVKAFI